MSVYSLIYVSSAVNLFSEEELNAVLDVSRRNNPALDVTGMLLYKDGNFMQFLEGPKENVIRLSKKIERDPRHRGMLTLLHQDRVEREFSEWSMGFRKLDSKQMPDIPGYTDFLALPLTSPQFKDNPSKTLKLLLNFKTLMR